MRPVRHGFVLCIGIALAIAGACWVIQDRWFRSKLAQAKKDMADRRYGAARSQLTRLASWWSAGGEIDYLLGSCEQAAGRPKDALAAWNRVPEHSPFSAKAAFQRGTLAMKLGQLAEAESSFLRTLRETGNQAVEVRRHLIALFWMEGRNDEVEALVEANWRQMSQPDWPQPDDATETIRNYIETKTGAVAVEEMTAVLTHAGKQAPDDDRVWLGRANLAVRAGHWDEAASWLEACLRRRPDDPAVWNSQLNWAWENDRVDLVRQALGHIPINRSSSRRVDALRAWFARHRGDIQAEEWALERLIASDPGNIVALERLAVLAVGTGQTERAARFRRRKSELDQAKQRYEHLIKDDALTSHTPELARLAETLGYRFESLALWTLAAQRSPNDREAQTALLRLASVEEPSAGTGRTLLEILAADIGTSGDPKPSTARPSAGKPPHFRDDALESGLTFTFESGCTENHQLPETMSGGVGLLDFDGDGWLDVYAVQGGPFPPGEATQRSGDRLFRNRGNGTFEDVSTSSKIASLANGYGHGVAVGDIDNDGHPDLFVTRWRAYLLLRNKGDSSFEDITRQAGLAGDRDWPTSAAFADLDNDGDLDLYVCHYAAWDATNPRLCPNSDGKGYESCDPRLVLAVPDHVFRNDDGKFIDVTAEAGIVDIEGRGLGVVTCDLDDDGRTDIFVANDGTANYYFRNKGGFRFEEIGLVAGVAGNAGGGYQAGMGVAYGDLDGDARLDLVVTNFAGESTTFYRNLGHGMFADQGSSIGLTAPSRFLLGFGAALLDVNNDAALDLVTANGHVNDYRPNIPYAMPMQLMIGGKGGRLTDVTTQAGPALSTPRLGRGLALGDLDNDGRVDAVVVSQDEPLAYLHNQSVAGHYLVLRLQGVKSNRDAVGAKVTIVAENHRQVSERVGGGSYQSANDSLLRFGLGPAQRIERVEIRWPSGQVDRYQDLAADAGFLITEGAHTPIPLKGWPHSSKSPQSTTAPTRSG